MNHNLGTEKVNRLLWELSIPAILGMLSSGIFNIVDRIFVGKISANALTAVGITMPIQVLQMAFVLLIGIGSSSLISIKLGKEDKKAAEDILYLAFQCGFLFLIGFAILFVLFLDPVFSLLSVSDEVYPYAKTYLIILMVGSIIGIPGYILNNSLRSIGQAKVSMKIVVATSILNMILDPIFIFGFRMGIAGAAIATVLSQAVLTGYVIYCFCYRKDFAIHLSKRKVNQRKELLREAGKIGLPSFFVQILATAVSVFMNQSFLNYGSNYDIAALTIISSIFSFYHMTITGIVQGNNAICGYNWGAGKYKRVKKSLELAMLYSFLLSTILFIGVELVPEWIVSVFTDDINLRRITASGMRFYLCMLPVVGLQYVSAQYFQAVGNARQSSFLAFLRYGVILVPAVLLLAPTMGVNGIYLGNALSDGIASFISIGFILVELRKLSSRTEEMPAE